MHFVKRYFTVEETQQIMEAGIWLKAKDPCQSI
jgi:hypothetical protein